MRSIKQGYQTFIKRIYNLTPGVDQGNILINNDTAIAGLRLPKGQTADRPSIPIAGDTRYNTDNNLLEYYDGVDWRSITYQQNQTITKDSFTGDGIATKFGPLTTTPSGENNILVFIQNVFQIGGSNYTLVDSLGGATPPLNYINFGSVPPLGHSIVILQGFDKT